MGGRKGSRTIDYRSLVSNYVDQTTTHGIRRISSSRQGGHRFFWVFIFLMSLGACCYHSSYLISNYASNPKVTITEERDAPYVEFPSITVCNLNVIKKDFGDAYFEMVSNDSDAETNPSRRKACFFSEYELLFESGPDLSDVLLNLGFTTQNLTEYGHQYRDMVVQCTYSSKGCNGSSNKFFIKVQNVTSPQFGLCHIISVVQKENGRPMVLKKGGTLTGIRLTLNIEREKYWDLISAAYGVRVLVHPQGTYPTLQRGGIIVSPGRSVHIGVKRRVSTLLPGWEGACTQSFATSSLMHLLADLGLNFDILKTKYTYEYCNSICQNAMLFSECGCLDEQPTASSKKSWRFCNLCNKNESDCRSRVLRNFTDNGSQCDNICKPSCYSVRYDISLSKSDWPNLNHQQFVVNRSRNDWINIPEALGLLSLPFDRDIENSNEFDLNDTFFSENLLRVHLFVEEMIYMSIEEQYSYTLPKLLADLGGCLGLYLGVSVISIIEIIELFGSVSIVCACRFRNSRKRHTFPSPRSKSGSVKKRRRNNHHPRSDGKDPFSTNFGTSTLFSRRRNQIATSETWRPPFSGFDLYNSYGTASARFDSSHRH